MTSPPGDTTNLAVLGRPWRRWTAIVEHHARRRGRCRVGPAEYDALYRELLAACQSPVATGGTDRQQYVEGLETVLRPWMTMRVLEKADQEIQIDLLARCRRIDRELNGRDWRAFARAWVWPAVVGLAAAFLISVAAYAVSGMSRPLNDWLDDEWRAARVAIQEASAIERMMAVGVIMIPFTVYLVHHIRKT